LESKTAKTPIFMIDSSTRIELLHRLGGYRPKDNNDLRPTNSTGIP
jgi:hypothetical protein